MFPYTDSAKSEVDMFPRTDVLKWHSFCPLQPRGVRSRNTSQGFLIIIEFTHFASFYNFNTNGDDFRNKEVIQGVRVRVGIWYNESRYVIIKSKYVIRKLWSRNIFNYNFIVFSL